MPRIARFVLPGVPHHITQRGNYRQKIYFRADDYQLYLDLLLDYSRHYGVAIHAYCLMPNHVHLIATPHKRDSFARTFRRVHSEYARALHTRLRRVGHCWQARYYSTPLDEKHFWQAMVYVEQNPLRAALVDQCEDWKWSSARPHILGQQCPLLDLVGWREHHSPETWSRCLHNGLASEALYDRIREATRTGRPLGSDDFLNRIEAACGRSTRTSRPGPKPKSTTRTPATTSSQLAPSARPA